MDSTVLVGLIAGVFGAIAAGIPAYFAQRNAPSRKVFDTASIVDSTGKVVTMYRTEIDRLDAELEEERQANDGFRKEIRVIKAEAELAQVEADNCRKQIEPMKRRIDHLEAVITNAGLDPNADTPNPPNK